MNQKTLLWLVSGTAVILTLAYLFSREMKPGPAGLPYYTFDKDSNKLVHSTTPDLRVSSFSFTDQRSDVVTEEVLEGKIAVADYFFVSCPGICREMGTQMQRISREFENEPDVLLLSHTSKPEEDTPEVLMAYANKLGVKNHDRWIFLTGDKKSLYKTARDQYHIVDDQGDGDEDDFIHTERFVLLDRKGYVRGYYDGTSQEDVDRLMKDIRKLL